MLMVKERCNCGDHHHYDVFIYRQLQNTLINDSNEAEHTQMKSSSELLSILLHITSRLHLHPSTE